MLFTAPSCSETMTRGADSVPKKFRSGTTAKYADAVAYARRPGHGSDKAFRGLRRCHGCSLVDRCPAHIYLMPCCGGCCLYGIWCVCGVPIPGISCVTACLCREGNAFITEKAGVKTGELLVVDEEEGTLAFYNSYCGDMDEDPCCVCTK